MKHIIKPRLDKILVKFPVAAQKTANGLIKPDVLLEEERKRLSNSALEVIAVGSKVDGINPGDKVSVIMGTQLQPLPFKTGDESYEYAILQDFQITGIVSEIED